MEVAPQYLVMYGVRASKWVGSYAANTSSLSQLIVFLLTLSHGSLLALALRPSDASMFFVSRKARIIERVATYRFFQGYGMPNQL